MVRRKDANSPAGKVDYLLHDLCVEWGFCAELSAERLLQAHPTLTGDLFARAVLEAEGMDPDLEKTWLRQIRERFAERFGPGASQG